MNPWDVLGVGHDVAVGDLRRHYAALIKQFRPETHPQDFARIREAYEVVLPHARRREAQAEARAEAEAETAVRNAASAGEAVHVEIDDRAGDTAEVREEAGAAAGSAEPAETIVAAALAGGAAPDDEPDLAARFHAFHALAQSTGDAGDEALLPALRDLLRARALASLDDSQALEFALMRWFVESEAPPLTLLFETGRVFDWHAHVVRLSGWLTPWALGRMEARLALSRDLVHARHFSGNAWLRGLHRARPHLPPVVLRPAAVEAQHWAERWRRGCAQGDVPALEAALNPVTLTRLQGLASTDLLAGAMVAALSPDLAAAALAGGATAASAFAARRVLQRVMRLPPGHRVRAAARLLVDNKVVTGLFVAVAGIIGLTLLADATTAPAGLVAGIALVLPATLLGLAMLWRLAAWIELAAALPFQWREAVDRLEFDRFLHGRTTPDANRPFADRLGLLQRLRAIGEARQLQAREVAARERPARARPFALTRMRIGASGNTWRVVWYVLWALFVLARVVHSVSN
jgi:hypothetical protein